jgi:hypothetical protein
MQATSFLQSAPMPQPYIENGRLRIPIDADKKFRWWEDGGQDVWTTLDELGIAETERGNYLQAYLLEHVIPNDKYVAIEINLQPGEPPSVSIIHDTTLPPKAVPFDFKQDQQKTHSQKGL